MRRIRDRLARWEVALKPLRARAILASLLATSILAGVVAARDLPQILTNDRGFVEYSDFTLVERNGKRGPYLRFEYKAELTSVHCPGSRVHMYYSILAADGSVLVERMHYGFLSGRKLGETKVFSVPTNGVTWDRIGTVKLWPECLGGR